MAYLISTHPGLVAQLEDPSLGETLTTGSNRKVTWVCTAHPDHRWDAVVASRVAGTGCPICAGRTVLEGFNDLRTTHPDLADQLEDQSLATTMTAGANRKVIWRCRLGHTWPAKVSNRASGHAGCPYCAGRLVLPGFNDMATTHEELAAQLTDPSLGTTLSAGSGKKVEWVCEKGHHWSDSPNSRTSRKGRIKPCPTCFGRRAAAGVNDLLVERPDLAAELTDPQPDGTPAAELAAALRPGANRTVSWTCRKHIRPYTWAATVNNRRAGTGCPVCSERVVQPGINDLQTTHPDLASEILDPQPDGRSRGQISAAISHGSHETLVWTCSSGHTWHAAVKDRVRGTGCPTCANTGTSGLEQEMIEVIRALVPTQDVHSRALISGRTGKRGASPSVDALIPSHSTAVEFNGLYWHSEACQTSSTYHRDKARLASRNGLRLIHVWEDEWLMRKGIAIRALAHRLNALDRLADAFAVAGISDQLTCEMAQRTHARSLYPVDVSRKDATAFLEAHHIQGSTLLTRSFGLVDENGTLRALLGLRSDRSNARMKRSPGQWEIQRYVTTGLVRGGFTRLLRHAERTLRAEGSPLTSWISFSDDGLSDGGMYRAAGFTEDAVLRPDYRYTGGMLGRTRAPKETFQKKRFRNDPALLWDENWTEHEAALANGLFRIYDAGKTRWVKQITSV